MERYIESEKMEIYCMLDVGGTYIKAGILSKDGCILFEPISTFDAKSKQSKEAIFQNFVYVLSELINNFSSRCKIETKIEIIGIGMAFPGPFDYEKGISKMVGIDKYDAIYGCEIAKELNKIWNKEVPMVFLHDVEAFAIGESHLGTAKNNNKVMYLCIGTGAGTAYSVGKEIIKIGSNTVPENGWIYNMPYKDGIIDDYLSSRGLISIAKTYFIEEISGEDLYKLAKIGDSRALQVFKIFGEDMENCLTPFLELFSPDQLVLGGQITKSIEYFGDGLKKYCKQHGLPISIASNTSHSIFQGLWIHFHKSYSNIDF